MFKKRSLIAVLLLTITLVMTLAFPAGAAEGKIYWVSNESQFISAANSSQDSDIIKLTSNITLSRPVKVKKSVNIDLQGHKLNGSVQYEYKEVIKYNYSDGGLSLGKIIVIYFAVFLGLFGICIAQC